MRHYPQQLLQQLADGQFHSGQAIATQLGVSRTAVWKKIRRTVIALGVEIEAVPGRGYRLTLPLELLDAEQIRAELQRHHLRQPSQLELHPQLDSTNRHLLDAALNGAPSGSVCLAEHQSAGRGRRGRRWISPFGGNLYLSLLHRSPRPPTTLGGLSIAVGLTLATLLRKLGGEEICVKWPNDLLWQGRKLGGVLIEVAGEQYGPSRAVIGVGLNLRLSTQQGGEIDQPWVDLYQIFGAEMPSRNQLAAQLIGALLELTETFEQYGLEPWLEQWNRLDHYANRPVRLLLGDREERGICRGIDSQGALLLEQEGKIRPFCGGEISLRKENREPS